MLSEKIITDQLHFTYRSIDSTNNNRQAVKRWCAVVWIAVLAVVFTGKLPVHHLSKFLFVLLPVLIFWFHEGLLAHHMQFLIQRAKELEKIILSGDYQVIEPKRLFYISFHEDITISLKIRTFLYSMFVMETVAVFYILLIFFSVFLLLSM